MKGREWSERRRRKRDEHGRVTPGVRAKQSLVLILFCESPAVVFIPGAHTSSLLVFDIDTYLGKVPTNLPKVPSRWSNLNWFWIVVA